MSEYSFSLVIDGDPEKHLDELFEAGCDDATFGTVAGVHYADFDREADSLADAISSAIRAIESVPGQRVLRVEPDDLVTASEIAKRMHRSRESVRLLIAGRRGRRNFPAPISHLRARIRLWRWSDVAAWAGDDQADVSEAHLVAAFNAALELRNVAETIPEQERVLLPSSVP